MSGINLLELQKLYVDKMRVLGNITNHAENINAEIEATVSIRELIRNYEPKSN